MIDAHHHVRRLADRGQPWIDPVTMAAAKLSGLVAEAHWTQWTVEQLRPPVRAAVRGGTARRWHGLLPT